MASSQQGFKKYSKNGLGRKDTDLQGFVVLLSAGRGGCVIQDSWPRGMRVAGAVRAGHCLSWNHGKAFRMIGVFDSGFGGLTVHRALIEALPGRDFVYLGDNRNAPYGMRPPIDVLNLTCAALERLFAEGCTLAVVA